MHDGVLEHHDQRLDALCLLEELESAASVDVEIAFFIHHLESNVLNHLPYQCDHLELRFFRQSVAD